MKLSRRSIIQRIDNVKLVLPDKYVFSLNNKESADELNEASWNNYDNRLLKNQFFVKEDAAPRLKSAIEDILRVHNVAVSKY